MNNIKNAVERSMKNIRSSLLGTIASVKKEDKSVFMNITDDEEIRDVKIVSPHGLFYLPNMEEMGQVVFNNSTKKSFLVGVEHDKLPVEIDVGEVILYNKNGGNYIYLKNDGSITIAGNRIDFKEI